MTPDIIKLYTEIQRLNGLRLAGEYSPAHQTRDFKEVFGSEAGARVLAMIGQEAGLFQQTTFPAEEQFVMEGKRNTFYGILRCITAMPQSDGSVKYLPLTPDPQKTESPNGGRNFGSDDAPNFFGTSSG